ncbi:MAG: hypothetical protein APR54_11120 [Candidatus Cloacimonas sp. SDB]|nr:MAG: hypothetical protein APR54_11120 [Candidatus Cloacimonas sp. SDB]
MIKLVFLFLISIILFSCATIDYIPESVSVSELSFVKYAEQDYLITLEPYLGKYESIGLVSGTIQPEANKIKIEVKRRLKYSSEIKNKSDNEYEIKTKKIWLIEPVDVYTLLDSIYYKSIEMGGNALVNFKLSAPLVYHFEGEVNLPEVNIEGFIIKRTDLE